MGHSSSKLAPEVACRLVACTHFDKKEITQLHAVFINDCPTGRLTRVDLLRIYRQFFPFGEPALFVDRLIRMVRRASEQLAEGTLLSTNTPHLNSGNSNDSPALTETSRPIETEDGISFTQYVMGMSVLSRGSIDEKLSWAFKFCDGDGDGWLDLEDIGSGLDAVHILLGNMVQANVAASAAISSDPNASARRLFAAMDIHSTGRADYEDFKRAVLEDCTEEGTHDRVLSKEVLQGLIFYDGLI